MERKFLNNISENSNTQEELTEEETNNPSSNTIGRDPNKDKHNKGHIVIPYTQGLGESIKKICSKYGIQTHFKGNRTIKEILVKPKDKDPIDKERGSSTGTSVGNSHARKSTWGRHPGPFEKDTRSTQKESSPIHPDRIQHFNIIGRTMA